MSQLLTAKSRVATSAAPCVPFLENGDRLTAGEFHRRYAAMPHVKKAELIQGIVYMSSPVRIEYHGKPHGQLMGWIAAYEAFTPGTFIGDNSTMQLDDLNTPQSDVCLGIDAERGGQTNVVDGYLVGGPELVAEVAASSVSYDLHQKRDVYAQFGVREYLIWRVFEREFDWFLLRDGRYEPLAADADGIFRSPLFPGLWLAAQSLIAGDLARVHAVLQSGLADPSHEAFVKRLSQKL
jgi:Uma2 family endonuclease